MACKTIKTYHIRGVVRTNYPIDVNSKIKAYSTKQAKLKLGFEILKTKNVKIPLKQLFNDIKKSKLLITEVKGDKK